MNGWIKLHRQLLEWEWYQDNNTFRVFLHLLLTARYEDGHSLGVPVSRGQVITGRRKLSAELGLSEKEIRTALDKLERTGEIIKKTANKYSIITVCNYSEYQSEEMDDGPAKGQQRASKGPLNKKERNKETSLEPESDPRFMEFWSRYPRKVNRPAAYKAWRKKGCGNGLFKEVMAGLEKYIDGPWIDRDQQFIPHAASWLNGERWNDEMKACGLPITDCSSCRYNQGEPCANLSRPGFNPADCDSFQRTEAR